VREAGVAAWAAAVRFGSGTPRNRARRAGPVSGLAALGPTYGRPGNADASPRSRGFAARPAGARHPQNELGPPIGPFPSRSAAPMLGRLTSPPLAGPGLGRPRASGGPGLGGPDARRGQGPT